MFSQHAFTGQPPVGLPTGSLVGVGEIIPPTGVVEHDTYVRLPAQEDCVGIAKQARNLGPQKIGNTVQGGAREGWSEFVPPLGVFDKLWIGCGVLEIRRADGRVDEFTQFHNYGEHTYAAPPVDPLDPTPNMVRVQVICLPARTTFPNGDTIRYHYDTEGRLEKLIDNYGREALSFEYEDEDSNRIVSMSDFLGRTTDFEYSGNLLTKVTYQMYPPRSWEFGYTTHTVQAPDIEVRQEMGSVTLIDEFKIKAPDDSWDRPYVHAFFDTANFTPPLSAYVETGRVTKLWVGGFKEQAPLDSIDLDGDQVVDYEVPHAGKESTYDYDLGTCFEDMVVEIGDSLGLCRTQTFDWQGREVSRVDENLGPSGEDLVTSFLYHGYYPTVWKTTSPKGVVTEEHFQFIADDDAGKSYFVYPAEEGEEQLLRDRFQGGNRLKLTRTPWEPQPQGHPQTIVEEWTYEPYLNQILTYEDANGHVTSSVYDYQEGSFSQSFSDYLLKWRIQLGTLPIGLSDQNGDGSLDQEFGLRVRYEQPVVATDGLTRQLNGNVDQTAVETTRYNDFGQVLWEKDAGGRYTSYSYYDANDPDGDGEPIDTNDPPGPANGYLKLTLVDSDPFGTQSSPLNLLTEFGYNSLGDNTWTRDPRGFYSVQFWSNYQQLFEERSGDITSAGDPVGTLEYTQVRYDYDLRNRRVRIRERNTEENTASRGVSPGHVTTYIGYDKNDNARVVSTQLIDPLGSEFDKWLTTFYHYDGNGNVVEEVSPQGRAKSYTYDALGRMTEKRVHLNWDTTPAAGNLPVLDVEDPILSFGYDEDSNKNRLTIAGSTPPLGTVPRDIGYRMEFDGFNRKKALLTWNEEADTELLRTEQVRDVRGNILSVRRMGPRDGTDTASVVLSEEAYDYDERNRLFKVTKAYFHWTKDAQGAWQFVDVGEASHLGTTVSETAYDSRSLGIATKDDLGRVTRIYFDGAGREIKRELPLVDGMTEVNREELTLDENGSVLAKVSFEIGRNDANSQIEERFETAWDYDALNRKIRERVKGSLDDPGTPEVEESASEYLTTLWEYTSLGDLRATWNPQGVGTRHVFDTQHRDVVTQFGFDLAMDPDMESSTGVVVGEDNSDQFIRTVRKYNVDGLLTVQKDDKNNLTTTDYDAAGRRSKLTYADSSWEEFTYNREGTLKEETRYDKDDILLTTIAYAYDEALRKTSADFSNTLTSNLSGVSLETFEYDGLSRVTRGIAVSDVPNKPSSWAITSTVEKEYDSAGLVRKDLQQFALTKPSGNVTFSDLVTSEYSGIGKCTFVGATGLTVDYTYDELNRIQSVSRNSSLLHSFEYLGSSFRLRKQTNVTTTETRLEIGTSGYDSFRRVTAMLYKGPDASGQGEIVQTSFAYAYDKLGNQLEEVKGHETANSKKFTYDKANRLKEYRVGTAPFTTSTLVEDFGLDGVGNWINHNSQPNAVTSVHEYVTEFDDTAVAYNGRGDLTQFGSKTLVYDAKGRIVGSNVGGQEYYFAFDVEGRRVLAETNFFVHAGLREIKQVKATDASVVQQYVYGNGLDELLSFTKAGSIYFVQRNRTGSTVALTSAAGTIVERYDYSPFGIVSGGGTVNCPYLFAGRRQDKNTGTYFLRARYYLAEMGRFTSRDPIGVWGDANNWGNPFSYGSNNPLSGSDPLGTEFWTRVRGVGKILGGVIEGAGGLAMIGTGGGAVPGFLVGIHAGDVIGTGASQLWTGEEKTTLTYQAMFGGMEAVGVPSEMASTLAAGGELLIDFASGVGVTKGLAGLGNSVDIVSDASGATSIAKSLNVAPALSGAATGSAALGNLASNTRPGSSGFSFSISSSGSTPGRTPLPENPDDLLRNGYAETTHPNAAAAGHRTFENSTTGDKVRFDKGKPNETGFKGRDHYHRANPNRTGKEDALLDKDGNPVAKGSAESHLLPGD